LAGTGRPENKNLPITSGRFYQATAAGYKPKEAGLNWVLRSFFSECLLLLYEYLRQIPYTDVKQVGGEGLTGCLYILLNGRLIPREARYSASCFFPSPLSNLKRLYRC